MFCRMWKNIRLSLTALYTIAFLLERVGTETTEVPRTKAATAGITTIPSMIPTILRFNDNFVKLEDQSALGIPSASMCNAIPDNERRRCGRPGIGRGYCERMRCCWDDSKQKCFMSFEAQCSSIAGWQRMPCGDNGVASRWQCAVQGCCYDDSEPRETICFQPFHEMCEMLPGDEQREACGTTNISRSGCVDIGCCFSDRIGCYQPKRAWCSNIPRKNQRQCGWEGIRKEQCEQMKCCWDDADCGTCYVSFEAQCMSVPRPQRQVCGIEMSITRTDCVMRGCCYDDSDSRETACFLSQSEMCNQLSDSDREEAGWPGISEDDCTKLGGCFSGSLCYNYARGFCTSTAVDERRVCGRPGISRQECQKMKCCWDPNATNRCFMSFGVQCGRMPKNQRRQCGSNGATSRSQCMRLGCCFDEGDHGDTACYLTQTTMCRLMEESDHLVVCGPAGTSKADCINRGCCYKGTTCYKFQEFA